MFSLVVIPDLLPTKNRHLEVILSKKSEICIFSVFASIKQTNFNKRKSGVNKSGKGLNSISKNQTEKLINTVENCCTRNSNLKLV